MNFPSQPPRITYGCRGALLGQLQFHDSIVPVYTSYGQIGSHVMRDCGQLKTYVVIEWPVSRFNTPGKRAMTKLSAQF